MGSESEEEEMNRREYNERERERIKKEIDEKYKIVNEEGECECKYDNGDIS